MRTSERKNYSVTSLDTDNIVVVMNGRTAAIVSQTLADAADVDEEMRALFGAFT